MSSTGFRFGSPVAIDTHGLLDAISSRLITPRPDCALWPDPDHQGYGRLVVGGRQMRVHRLFWELINGPIPDGMTIDHLCRVRSCCNTDHMEVVTPGENSRRGARGPIGPMGTGRFTGTHCKHGHEFTPENTYIKRDGRRCRACAREWEANRPPRKRR